jgi:hypothetical protein
MARAARSASTGRFIKAAGRSSRHTAGRRTAHAGRTARRAGRATGQGARRTAQGWLRVGR